MVNIEQRVTAVMEKHGFPNWNQAKRSNLNEEQKWFLQILHGVCTEYVNGIGTLRDLDLCLNRLAPVGKTLFNVA